MTIKDIIEKLEDERDKVRRIRNNNDSGFYYEGQLVFANGILKWIKSNLEEKE